MSFTDILRKAVADPEMIDLGGIVSRIKETQKGDLKMKLNKSSERTANSFRHQVDEIILRKEMS